MTAQTFYAALWQDGAIKNLGTLGDFAAISQRHQQQGPSGRKQPWTPNFNFDLHAFIWQDDVMTDLSTLIFRQNPTSSPPWLTRSTRADKSWEWRRFLSGPHEGEDPRLSGNTRRRKNRQVDCGCPHPHTRNPICPQMLANSFCRDSYAARFEQ